jgi:undecaprenyl-diphosphatase
VGRNVERVIEWFRRMVGLMNASDRAIGDRVAELPPSPADRGLKILTRSANHGLLWFAVAAALAARAGVTRRGALRGIAAITIASATANGLCKPLLPRRRPPAELLPARRALSHRPTSSSFPSGHAASAAAIATAVTMESPRTGATIVPLAAVVAYSRVHVGVHWTSDVLAGAAVGVGSALLTRRWWPVRDSDEASARPLNRVPRLPAGQGLLVAVNPLSGDPSVDPTREVRTAFPAAKVVVVDGDTALEESLASELSRAGGVIKALGVVGGDGTVGTVTTVANHHQLPLVLVPSGTLNHFARDVGVYDLQEAVDATSAGEAVEVDLGLVDVDGGSAECHFLNTASLGCYSHLVELRERWEGRWGKWPAFLAALVTTLHRATPLRARMDGTRRSVWVLFVGNGPYHPAGMVPAWRPRLDSGLLDVRWLRADVPFSRFRACWALSLAALSHSRVYHQYEAGELTVELTEPSALATDGELVAEGTRFRFRMARRPVPVYRRDENNPRWATRQRPHQPL